MASPGLRRRRRARIRARKNPPVVQVDNKPKAGDEKKVDKKVDKKVNKEKAVTPKQEKKESAKKAD